MASEPKSLQEAIVYFNDFENCKKFMIALRWPTGKVACPRCGAEKVTWLEKPRVWKCYAKHEKPTFTLKTGTVFEDSPIALEKWLPAVWLIVTCKNGISSYEIARDLDISQKSAWHMAHRIRFALHSGSFGKMLSGEVEADETFIGGKARNMHVAQRQRRITGTGTKDKTPVMGILERGKDGKSRVRTSVIPNRKKTAIQGEVRKHVEAGSALYTDFLLSYEGLAGEYAHKVVDHAVEYVHGNTHTNGLENYWSLLKRTISGTYVSVEPFHLFRYLDDQSYRFNNRGKDMNNFERFKLAMTQVVGKRLTWDALTGKGQDLQTPSVN
jgi:transposase-like protein